MAAKKISTATKSKVSSAVSSTPVRNTSIPPRATTTRTTTTSAIGTAKKSAPTFDQIALRAYSIYASGQGGSQDDNWFRAERELRGA